VHVVQLTILYLKQHNFLTLWIPRVSFGCNVELWNKEMNKVAWIQWVLHRVSRLSKNSDRDRA